MTQAKNTICLWYDKDAEEAARFYAETFPDSSVDAVHLAPGDFPDGKKGQVLTVDFTVMGIPCMGLNGGPTFKHSEAFSFQIATKDQEETDRYWNAIVGNGGEESMCGWCKDKWGLSWQITPIALTKGVTDPDPAVAKRVFDDDDHEKDRHRRDRSRTSGLGLLVPHMRSLYEAAGGREGILKLASAWHARVTEDEIVSHAFSHGFHPQHTERLAAYWSEALGGPAEYSQQYGDETSVVRIHSGNGVHEEMDRRAIACFDQAMNDIGITPTDPLRQVLHDYFAWTTTTTMARYHRSPDDVPEGMIIPKWSWDGLVSKMEP